VHLPHRCNVHARLSALVNAGRLGFRNPLYLPLFADGRFELGEHAEHIEERRGQTGGERIVVGAEVIVLKLVPGQKS
jgi:2-iminoacetate synthase ThiH